MSTERKRRLGDGFTAVERILILAAPPLAAVTLMYQWQKDVGERLADADVLRVRVVQQQQTIAVLQHKLAAIGTQHGVGTLEEIAAIASGRVRVDVYGEERAMIRVRGSAVRYEDMIAFADKLKESKFFSDVVIESAAEMPEGGPIGFDIPIEFNISARLKDADEYKGPPPGHDQRQSPLGDFPLRDQPLAPGLR